MRLLKRDDEPLHEEKMEQVRAYLQSAPFDLRDASTIDAKEEAIYAWVTANYLNRNLTTKTGNGTIGILELGGASGQIAFVPQNQMPEDTNVVHIAGNKYRVYARGYDGVGKTEITKAFENEKSCFPRNYEGSGEGDYDTCQERIIEFLKTTDRRALRRLREETPPRLRRKFLGDLELLPHTKFLRSRERTGLRKIGRRWIEILYRRLGKNSCGQPGCAAKISIGTLLDVSLYPSSPLGWVSRRGRRRSCDASARRKRG